MLPFQSAFIAVAPSHAEEGPSLESRKSFNPLSSRWPVSRSTKRHGWEHHLSIRAFIAVARLTSTINSETRLVKFQSAFIAVARLTHSALPAAHHFGLFQSAFIAVARLTCRRMLKLTIQRKSFNPLSSRWPVSPSHVVADGTAIGFNPLSSRWPVSPIDADGDQGAVFVSIRFHRGGPSHYS